MVVNLERELPSDRSPRATSVGSIRYSHSFAYDLDLILDGVPSALVSPQDRSMFHRLAVRLPSLDGGLELRLGAPGAPVDLSVCSDDSVPSSLVALAGREPTVMLDPALLLNSGWSAVPDFAAAILDRRPPHEKPGASKFWLEFDRAAFASETPVPCLMVSRALSPEESVLAELDRSYQAATGAPPGPGIRQAATAALAGLGNEVTVTSVGALVGRPGSPARLRVNSNTETAVRLIEVLTAPWGETLALPLRHADQLVARITPYQSATLDLYEDRPPRIGLPVPCSIIPRAKPARFSALEAALDVLSAEGLCRPEVADALRTWPGWMHDPRSVVDFPHHSAVSPGGVLLRVMKQFKLSFDEAGRLEAKAYVGTLRRRR